MFFSFIFILFFFTISLLIFSLSFCSGYANSSAVFPGCFVRPHSNTSFQFLSFLSGRIDLPGFNPFCHHYCTMWYLFLYHVYGSAFSLRHFCDSFHSSVCMMFIFFQSFLTSLNSSRLRFCLTSSDEHLLVVRQDTTGKVYF